MTRPFRKQYEVSLSGEYEVRMRLDLTERLESIEARLVKRPHPPKGFDLLRMSQLARVLSA